MNLDRLREIRKDRQVKQSTISERLGYKSPSGYNSLETGVHKMTVDQAAIIGNELNMTAQEKVEVFLT